MATGAFSADAWATALTAMPYEKALALAKEKDIAALFVILADGVKANGLSSDSVDSDQQANSIDHWQIVETPAMQVLRADKKL